jgi:hypothetical protein
MELEYPSECPGPRARGGEMATKLYRVRSTKSDGTEIVWIAFRKDPPVRYAKAIDGLSADVDADSRQRHSVDELFTFEEAEQWYEYLERHYHGDLDSEIVEVDLPLAPNTEALSYASSERTRREAKRAGYPFSHFEVHGYEVQHS